MTPEQLKGDLAWQTERANTAVNRFQEMRAERDALTQTLADLREEKNREISKYKNDWQGFAQRASEAKQRAEHFKAERDALQAELSSLKADMFVLNNDMAYTTGVLDEVLKQRDALQSRIDGALAMLDERSGVPFGSQYYNEEIEFYEGMRESLQRLLSGKSDRYLKAVEILTGEGE